MKKTKRIIAIMLTLILCLSATSCVMTPSELKEMKQWHGVWTDVSRSGIIFNGIEYKLLPDCETLSPFTSSMKSVFVTDADVPVMLCYKYGETYDITDDGVIITGYEYSYDGEEKIFNYCRVDKYDEVVDYINNRPEFNGLCYEYYDYKNDFNTIYKLTDEQIDAVNAVRAAEPTVLSYDSTIDYDYSLSLDACTDGLLFREYVTNLCVLEGKYFFADFDDYETRLYQAPEEYNDILESVMDAYLTSEKTWEEMYGEYEYDYEYDYLDDEEM